MVSLLLIWLAIFLISYIYKSIIRKLVNVRGRERSVSDREVKTERTGGTVREEFGPTVETIQDPVCGVYFPESEAISRNVLGQKMSFCSEKCAARYLAEHPPIRPEAHAFTV